MAVSAEALVLGPLPQTNTAAEATALPFDRRLPSAASRWYWLRVGTVGHPNVAFLAVVNWEPGTPTPFRFAEAHQC